MCATKTWDIFFTFSVTFRRSDICDRRLDCIVTCDPRGEMRLFEERLPFLSLDLRLFCEILSLSIVSKSNSVFFWNENFCFKWVILYVIYWIWNSSGYCLKNLPSITATKTTKTTEKMIKNKINKPFQMQEQEKAIFISHLTIDPWTRPFHFFLF